jgi:cytochrome c2
MYSLFLIVTFFLLSCKDSEEKKHLNIVAKGQNLFTTVGCATCHSLTEDKLYGPSLHAILGKKTKVIRNGKEHSFVIDRDYIKNSIKNPDYEKSILFKSQKMPKPSLTDFEIDCITNYLISINKKNTAQ